MKKFIAGIVIQVLLDERVQEKIRELLGQLITERILPLVPVATAAAAKAVGDQLSELLPNLDGIVDVVKVGDAARNTLNDLIPDIDLGIPAIDDLMDFWRPKNK